MPQIMQPYKATELREDTMTGCDSTVCVVQPGMVDRMACLCDPETLRRTIARQRLEIAQLNRELEMARTVERVTTEHLDRQTRRSKQLERRLAKILAAAQDD